MNSRILYALIFVTFTCHFNQGKMEKISLRMPGVSPRRNDSYICTSLELPEDPVYIVQYEPNAHKERAHHMLLFGCEEPGSDEKFWNCGDMGSGTCSGSESILFGWARDAPALKLPKDVGFKIGGNTKIQYLTLQIHYVHALKESVFDSSGLTMKITEVPQLNLASIYLLVAGYASIPPHTKGYHVDVACKYDSDQDIHAFAFRTHAHDLSRVITGYRVRNNMWTMLGKGDPHAPQAFYRMDNVTTIRKGDILAARCTYDTLHSGRRKATVMGSTAADEMCNFYMMFYRSANTNVEIPETCFDQITYRSLYDSFPNGSDVALSSGSHHHHHHHVNSNERRNEIITESNITVVSTSIPERTSNISDYSLKDTRIEHNMSDIVYHRLTRSTQSLSRETNTNTPKPTMNNQWTSTPNVTMVTSWPSSVIEGLGQVTGLAVDSADYLFLFHRCERVWDWNTFSRDNVFQNAQSRGPIGSPTILILDSVSGKVLEKHGSNMFYLPHGMTIDHQDNLWLTDVGRHQVLKFPRGEYKKPSLVLGEKLFPGSGYEHFCKPTDVAVEISGVFYVADGYCNSRILKFSSQGRLLKVWGKSSIQFGRLPSSFNIPHSLALDHKRSMLYVADRENGRVQCFDTYGKFHKEISSPKFGGLVFAVDFNEKDGLLYAVNSGVDVKVQGFSIDPESGKIFATWSPPSTKGFSQPHDLVSNGSNIFVAEIGPNKVWKFRNSIAASEDENFARQVDADFVNSTFPQGFDNVTTVNPDGFRQLDDSSNALMILVPLSITICVIFAAACVVCRVLRSRNKPKYDIMDISLGNYRTSEDWCSTVSCCNRSHQNIEELYLMDSDSDVELYPDVRVGKK